MNKTSELMLMRHTRAYSNSCLQVILVYLHPFHRSLPYCSQKPPKNHKESLFLGFKINQGHDVDNPKKLVASSCYV